MEETPEIIKQGNRLSGSITYCVTGASGYIGSWLVKSLLERGYKVHATVRDPGKSLQLLKLWGAGDRLRLFKSDLQEEGSFDDAVRGCNGLFHVAASMEFGVPEKDNVESFVQRNVVDPAIKGTLNVLKACLKANSIRRVVFTSSISTLTAKDDSGKWKAIVDESCQTPICDVWNAKATGWVYVLSKLLAEEAAFKYASENGIQVISVITTTVAGPFLTSTVPSSIRVLLSPVTGDPEFFPILAAVHSRMGSIGLVHIEDACDAHIFLMEHAKAEGRYICCTQSCAMSELVALLSRLHPCSNIERIVKENNYSVPSEISSTKLRALGFSYKYSVEDILHHTVSKSMEHGFLPLIQK